MLNAEENLFFMGIECSVQPFFLYGLMNADVANLIMCLTNLYLALLSHERSTLGSLSETSTDF